MSEITPANLSARLAAEEDDPFILDVQPAEDFEDWHVPGSLNLDISVEDANGPGRTRH